jgi:transcriptional regulator
MGSLANMVTGYLLTDALAPAISPLDTPVQCAKNEHQEITGMPSEPTNRVELLQGTLDLIVLRALHTMGPQHAYGLAARLEQVAEPSLVLNQGTLYPALVRLEQKGWIRGTWQRTESNRDAKYYNITNAGVRGLHKQTERWRRLSGLVEKLLLNEE